MERNKFCKTPVLESKNLLDIYQALVCWIATKNYVQVEETLYELHLNYNNCNPYAFKVLVGEITIKMPTDTLSYFANFFITKLHISTKEIEYYIENRIHLILEENDESWHQGIDDMLSNQAHSILKNAVALDHEASHTQLKHDNLGWADQVMA